MEFVPYNRFNDIEFIAEGGKMMVALKELNNSKNITPEELNETSNSSIMYEYTDSYYDFNHYHDISNHYGITKNPITQNFVIVTDYYEGNNLTREIAKHF
ncbi:unnamed protein product [Rhizophagus irregularis]|nr:unnamed protein product [Rhizophagus irregularis]